MDNERIRNWANALTEEDHKAINYSNNDDGMIDDWADELNNEEVRMIKDSMGVDVTDHQNSKANDNWPITASGELRKLRNRAASVLSVNGEFTKGDRVYIAKRLIECAKKEVPEAFKKQWKNKDKDGDGKENEPKPDFLKKKEAAKRGDIMSDIGTLDSLIFKAIKYSKSIKWHDSYDKSAFRSYHKSIQKLLDARKELGKTAAMLDRFDAYTDPQDEWTY
jgi:hypothetical protein